MTPITLPGDSPEGYLAAAPGTQILDQNGGTWTKVSGISSTGWHSAATATQTPTLTVPTVAAMQVLIDAGEQAIGQLYYIEADSSTRRYEGGSLSTIINDYPQLNPEGYATMTSVKLGDISATVKHDGTDGATGICYCVDGGTTVYKAKIADTNTSLSIPSKQGAPINIAIWPAASATSGRKGNLTLLSLSNNKLTSFNGTGLSALNTLTLTNNQLTSFNGTGLSALNTLDLSSNQLTSFNGAGLTTLTELYLTNNNLTSFNVAGLTALTDLSLSSNNLTSFNGTGLSALNTLDLSYNQLTSFNGTGLSAVTELRLDSNNLTSFNGTGLTAVTALYINNNQLTSFNGAGLSAVTILYINSNQLTSFNGAGLSAVTALYIYNNQLTSFTVGELQLYDVYSYYLALNLINQQLDAAAIQQIYDDLPDGTSYGDSYPNTIDVTGNPGAGAGSGTTPATATAQGWIVVGDVI